MYCVKQIHELKNVRKIGLNNKEEFTSQSQIK